MNELSPKLNDADQVRKAIRRRCSGDGGRLDADRRPDGRHEDDAAGWQAAHIFPQWPAEDKQNPTSRAFRSATATLFPAYARTISVLTGKPFSKPITIGEDVQPRIAPWLEDVDLAGREICTHLRRIYLR